MSLDEERMAALRARFAASLAARADELAELLEQGDLAGIQGLAHGLAGRSAMFGFAALGETARNVDEAEADEMPPRARVLLAALREAAQEA